MRRAGLVGALALAVLINGLVLAGVAWNRAGTPDATLVLTERELLLRDGVFRGREDSGVALSLQTAPAPAQWLDEAKLRQLGFAPQRWYARDGSDGRVKWPLPRKAYVVLEYDGPAWAALVEAQERRVAALPAEIEAGQRTDRELLSAEQELARMRESGSRLVAVDAGLDADVLRGQYPDGSRYAITPAEIRMGYGPRWSHDGPEGDAVVQGHIGHMLTASIHVPVQFHAALRAAVAGQRRGGEPRDGAAYGLQGPPRYAVTVHYGQRHEPWIEGIQPLP